MIYVLSRDFLLYGEAENNKIIKSYKDFSNKETVLYKGMYD